MSHWSLRACGSHGTTTSWISFHPLQHKQSRRKESDCVRNKRGLLLTAGSVRQEPHLLASLSWSACGPSISCGSRFSLWTHFTLHNHPPQKKKQSTQHSEKSDVKISKSLLCYLYIFIVSLSVQACLGNPSHPVEREKSRWDAEQVHAQHELLHYNWWAFPPCRLLLHSHHGLLENPGEQTSRCYITHNHRKMSLSAHLNVSSTDNN